MEYPAKQPRPYDAESDIAAWVIGSGIVFIQVCAVIPGLLPFLLLLVPFLLPFVVLGLVVALLVGLPVGIWRLVAWALRPLLRSVSRTRPTTATPEASDA